MFICHMRVKFFPNYSYRKFWYYWRYCFNEVLIFDVECVHGTIGAAVDCIVLILFAPLLQWCRYVLIFFAPFLQKCKHVFILFELLLPKCRNVLILIASLLYGSDCTCSWNKKKKYLYWKTRYFCVNFWGQRRHHYNVSHKVGAKCCRICFP